MARGRDPRLSAGLALPGVGRVSPAGAGLGRRGNRHYPTVLEAYDRDSDFKRWQAGQRLAEDLGALQGRLIERLQLRHLVDDGTSRLWHPLSVVRFPGSSAPDGGWSVCWRHRGAVLLPEPLDASRISLDPGPPTVSRARLNVDVSLSMSASQLRAFEAYIGCQFENGAIGGAYPNDLLESDPTVIAFTLVEVDAEAKVLRFDLARPVLLRRVGLRRYWTPVAYRPEAPVAWNGGLGRYLISCDQFYCNCPDYSAQVVASLPDEAASSRRFPRVSAGQRALDFWQERQVGTSNRWRSLDVRADRRRECKHIHALRWIAGVPFAEPSDYGSGGALPPGSGALTAQVVQRYQGRRDLDLDQLVPALAPVCSLDPLPRERPDDATILSRQPGSRWLWTGATPPLAAWCQPGDWWQGRGTGELAIFDGQAGVLRSQVSESGTPTAVLQPVLEYNGLDGTVLP